ncbi:copia protein [Tanacetum coccineum]|uniref:Copia protein n=1 Tax=Tanacetum coccineum TaxID=301880 RepID=A0ABQ5HNP1_9ASTR
MRDEKNKDETCLVAQASNEKCLGINLEPDEWIKDSGCSKHMTGNRRLFSTYQAYNGGNVIFGSNLRGNIIGKVEEEAIEVNKTRPLGNDLEDKSLENNEIINIKESKSHPLDNVIGNLNQRTLRLQAQDKNFKLFQMDVKSAFLNGFINEEVYVAQPPGFIDFAKPNHVYRLKKALYGLKQAPKAWYDRLKSFLIKHDYTMGMKQTALAISTTEAEYVSAEKACQQALWMKQALVDYGISLDDIPIMCDNKGAIDLSKNPVQHSRTKHIEIRHHFLRDNVQKGNISIEKVSSEDNIANILTKSLKREPFNYLRLGLGMMEQID